MVNNINDMNMVYEIFENIYVIRAEVSHIGKSFVVMATMKSRHLPRFWSSKYDDNNYFEIFSFCFVIFPRLLFISTSI